MLQVLSIAFVTWDIRKRTESALMSMSVPMTNGINAQSMLSASISRVHSIVNVKLDLKVMVLFVMTSMNVIKTLIIVT